MRFKRGLLTFHSVELRSCLRDLVNYRMPLEKTPLSLLRLAITLIEYRHEVLLSLRHRLTRVARINQCTLVERPSITVLASGSE